MRSPEILILEVASGPNKGAQFLIAKGDEFIVGRCRTASCYIMDLRISRKHFLISFCNGCWAIEDIGSANGTFINNEIVSESILKDNDCIQAGDTFFRIFANAPPTHSSSYEPTGDRNVE